MLVRLVAFGIVFAAATIFLVLGYQRAEPVEAAEGGGVRAVGAMPGDYAFTYAAVEVTPFTPEGLATAAVYELAEQQGFSFKSVTCQRRFGADYCAVCFTDNNRKRARLGAALVRCAGTDCRFPLDEGEFERIGFVPEMACGSVQ